LTAHVRLLEQKGYVVETATNGDDAIQLVMEKGYDLVFLDEMMPGKGGLQTLAEIKDAEPNLPVIMVTKNEAESLMEEAIGGKITDYLTKPVNPSQILMAVKKILESKKITGEAMSRDYAKELQNIAISLMNPLDEQEWIDLYIRLTNWDMELDGHPELGLRQTVLDQKRECNVEFSKFVERKYRSWIESDKRPIPLSPDVLDKFVVPELGKGRSVFFFVIDCMRLDQWLMVEPLVAEYPQNAVFRLLLGDMYAKLARNDQAAAQFRAAEHLAAEGKIADPACATRVREISHASLAALKQP